MMCCLEEDADISVSQPYLLLCHKISIVADINRVIFIQSIASSCAVR